MMKDTHSERPSDMLSFQNQNQGDFRKKLVGHIFFPKTKTDN